MWLDDNDDYNTILWNKIEKFSFFYPLSQIRKLKPRLRKAISILWIISIIWIGSLIYSLIGNKIVNEYSPAIIFLAIGVVLVSIWPIAIIFLLFSECRFSAWIYDKWIELQWSGYLYDGELKEIKMYQYFENWNEYIKLISTELNGKITVQPFLYNPKIDIFLRKIQELFQENGVVFEKISDVKGIDISAPIEYRARFWFFSVWKLLSQEEKIHRIKNAMLFILLYLLFWGMLFISSLFWDEDTSYSEAIQQLPENFYSWLRIFLIMLVILMIFLIIHFIISVKKFYARKENNFVCIYNGYWWKWINLPENYVLSKINANYWIISEWNLEWIMLTIDDGDKTRIYKRPKNEEVERFCNDLLIEIKKHKEI